MATPMKFKLKQVPTDVWSIREKLCLASSVMRSGDQNWVSVSRAIKTFGEPNRPADWFSQKNCALQYSDLLDKVETPKRKRGEREIETPGECIVKKLTQERIEELKRITEETHQNYKKQKLEYDQVNSGMVDDQLETIWQQMLDTKKQAKEEEEKHEKWLIERETNRQAVLASMKSAKIPAIPIAKQKKGFKQNRSMRRNSSQSDHGSESESVANSPLDETIKLEQVEETSTSSSLPDETTKASPVLPVSPLLTSLLENPSPATTQPGLATHSPVISPIKDEPVEKPTLTSPTVINKIPEENSSKPTHLSPSAGAPTLSRLLELPLTSPGKPLPSIPIPSTVSTPTENTEKTIEVEEKPSLPKSPEQSNSASSTVVDIPTTTSEVDSGTKETQVDVEVDVTVEVEEAEQDAMNETLGTEELSVSSEKIEEQVVVPKVENELPVTEEVISFQDDQDVQTNIEIEENELEVVVQENVVPEVSETKPDTPVKIKEETQEPAIEETQQVPAETEPTQPPIETQPPVVEEKVIEQPELPPPVKQVATPKLGRGKRERTSRRGSGAKTEKPTPVVQKTEIVPAEPVAENVETTEKEIKEKVPDKKPIEEKVRGRKAKRRRETKESSDDSNESNVPKRKQPVRRERRKPEPTTQKRPRKHQKGSSSSSEEEEKTERKPEPPVKTEVPSDSIPNSPSSLSHSDDPDSLRDYKLWKKAIMLVWRSAANHKYANVFLHPVTDDVAPGYSSVVYRPMDLSQIKKGIESGAIKTTPEFQRDMMLMFQNAIMYNSSDHDVFHMAVEMQKEVENHIQDFLATQLMAQTTEAPKNFRRETRELSHKRTASSEYRDRIERNTPEVEGSKTKKRRTRAIEHD